MKKSLIVVLLLSLSLLALNLSARNMAGIKVGGNITQTRGTDVDTDLVEPTVTPFVGFFMTAELNPFFAIQPEFNFSVKGFQYKDYTDTTSGITDNLQNLKYYLEIPLLFKLQVPSEMSTFAFYAGPYIAFLTKETLKLGEEEMDISGFTDTNDVEYGVVIGASLDFFMNENEVVTVDGRYALGLSKVYPGDEIYNSAFSILVGYGWAY